MLKTEKLKKNRNEDSIPISEALEGYFKAIGMDDKIRETRVLSQWEDIVGTPIAVRTLSKNIKNGILYLTINSSVMRDEIYHLKTEIIDKVNQAAGKELITDLFLK